MPFKRFAQYSAALCVVMGNAFIFISEISLSELVFANRLLAAIF